MANNISFNPSLMTAAQNTFLLETQGWIQGLTQDDPVSRMHLLAGIVASTVTQPVWGGMGIAANTAELATDNRQGPSIALASTTQINGFTVFDQAINMIQTPGNTAPVSVAGQSVAFYLFGSKARIPLPLDSGVITNLENVSASTPLFYDTATFSITNVSSSSTIALPATTQLLAVNANSKMVAYNSTTGAVSWLAGQSACLLQL